MGVCIRGARITLPNELSGDVEGSALRLVVVFLKLSKRRSDILGRTHGTEPARVDWTPSFDGRRLSPPPSANPLLREESGAVERRHT